MTPVPHSRDSSLKISHGLFMALEHRLQFVLLAILQGTRLVGGSRTQLLNLARQIAYSLVDYLWIMETWEQLSVKPKRFLLVEISKRHKMLIFNSQRNDTNCRYSRLFSPPPIHLVTGSQTYFLNLACRIAYSVINCLHTAKTKGKER